MKILGIETSCDETAVAVVTDDKKILSNLIFSQIAEHQDYGGVVPEIAARAHMEKITPLVKKALVESGIGFAELDGIAATAGPGLIGGLIVGVMMAKSIASAAKKPFYAINHLEGHALTARLTGEIDFPFLLLLVSGGHCQILAVENVGKYKLLGKTQDDALGEAFDKTAKMLGLGYPGGPALEKLAKSGDKTRFRFPRAMKGRPGCDFSFSGVKTAINRLVKDLGAPSERDKCDIAASFQQCAAEIVYDRMKNAIEIFRTSYPGANRLVIAGGVAANEYLKSALRELAAAENFELFSPPVALCTDNAAMIAWAGIEKIMAGHSPDGLEFPPMARWPLA